MTANDNQHDITTRNINLQAAMTGPRTPCSLWDSQLPPPLLSHVLCALLSACRAEERTKIYKKTGPPASWWRSDYNISAYKSVQS